MNTGPAYIRNVTVVDPSAPIVDAARLMRERHVGCLIVACHGVPGRMPVGMLTDHDIVTAIVARRGAARRVSIDALHGEGCDDGAAGHRARERRASRRAARAD